MISLPVDALLGSAVLMAAVLLLRAPVRRLFGPTVAYALWSLPAVRMVLPPMPESWRAAEPTPISQASELVQHAIVAPQVAAPGVEGTDWTALAVHAWAVVAAAFLLFHFVQYLVFRTRLLRRHRPVERIGSVRVVLSPAAPGPLAFGVVSRYVALPADLDERYDADEQALALAHELGHHARGDLLANWVALTLLAIHWWNPLAWAAHRAFRADQELANDARVLRDRGPDAAHAYACAILKAAHGGAIAAACHLHTVNDLKGRLRMLKSGPASARRLLSGAATVTIVVAAGLALTASGTSAAAAVKEHVGETIGVDLDEGIAIELPEIVARAAPTAWPAPVAPAASPAPLAPAVAIAVAQDMPVPPTPPAPPAPAVAYPAAPVPPSPPVPPSVVGKQHRFVIVKDKDGRVTRRVFTRRNGKAPHAFAYSFGDRFPFGEKDAPEVREMRCGGGESPTVRHELKDGKRVTIICTDRIERMAERHSRLAERHAEMAANSVEIRRHALEGALAGLRAAREAIRSNPQLTAEEKREALEGIENGERDVRESLSGKD